MLIHNNTFSTRTTSTTGHSSSQYYDTSSYGQHHQQYPSQAYTDMLLEEAEKLYVKLAKDLVMKLLLITLPAHPHHNTIVTTVRRTTKSSNNSN